MKRFPFRLMVVFTVLLAQCTAVTTDDETNFDGLEVSFSMDKEETAVDSPVTFTSKMSIFEQEVISWQWDFADGTPFVTTKDARHTFKQAGSYLVKLTVKIKSGKTAEWSQRVLVKNASSPDYGNLTGLRQKLALLYPKIMVAAHRGYTKNFPENSVKALTDAADHHIPIAEIDVRITADNELVIMHDASTGRTATENVNVAEKTLKELKELRLKYNGNITDLTIPTLSECLNAAKGRIYVAIDASKINSLFFINKIYNTVASLNMVDMVIIYVTSSETAKTLLQMDRGVQVLLGAGNAADYNNASNMNPYAPVWHLSTATLAPLYTNGPAKAGVKFWANAYVNSTDAPPQDGNDPVVANLIANQVSLIQTDYPLEIISYLKKQNLWLE